MIGHYVHHHGTGHLHRALTIAAHLPGPVTGLSSLPRPAGWAGDWVRLPRDDDAAAYPSEAAVTAGDRLHWVPLGDAGLRGRAAAISRWIDDAAPSVVVVDQSVEVCLLARLHGIPVVAFTAPGRRSDAAHRLAFDTATALVGPWPDACTPRLLPGLDTHVRDRFTGIGAVSRFAVTPRTRTSGRRKHVVLLAGTGGDGFTAEGVARAQESTPDWDWTVLSRTLGTWHPDPAAVLADADVAVLHPGQNSLAEVAALRVPAVVVPAPRPFDEQHVTADALRHGWPAVVAESPDPTTGWGDLLGAALELDGDGWDAWCDGRAPERAAAVVRAAMSGGCAS